MKRWRGGRDGIRASSKKGRWGGRHNGRGRNLNAEKWIEGEEGGGALEWREGEGGIRVRGRQGVHI